MPFSGGSPLWVDAFLTGLFVGGFLLLFVALFAVRTRDRLRAALDVANRRGAKEHERVEALERRLQAVGAEDAPEARTSRTVLDATERATRDIASAVTRDEVLAALGRAVVATLAPKQWMVFVAADAEGKELVVVASGCEEGGQVWQPGARLSSQTGKVGLVLRRRAPMDTRDFDAEPPIVREQVARTEPREFALDAVVPIRVGDRVAAVLAVGGSAAHVSVARTSLDLLVHVASLVLRGLTAHERAVRFENQDTLTGIGNRSWFNADASEVVYRIRQEGGRAVVVLLGIDHYAHYVRRNGHGAADKLVRGVAQVLRPLVPENALFARWTADEFAVLVPDADLETASALARRARAAVASVAWPAAGHQPGGRVSLCAGISTFPASGDTLESMIEAAAHTLGEARASDGHTTGSILLDAGIAGVHVDEIEPHGGAEHDAAAAGAPHSDSDAIRG